MSEPPEKTLRSGKNRRADEGSKQLPTHCPLGRAEVALIPGLKSHCSTADTALRALCRNVSRLHAITCKDCSMLCDMSRQVGGLSVSPRGLSYVVAPDSPPPLSALLRGCPPDTTIIFQGKDTSVDRIVETDVAYL